MTGDVLSFVGPACGCCGTSGDADNAAARFTPVLLTGASAVESLSDIEPASPSFPLASLPPFSIELLSLAPEMVSKTSAVVGGGDGVGNEDKTGLVVAAELELLFTRCKSIAEASASFPFRVPPSSPVPTTFRSPEAGEVNAGIGSKDASGDDWNADHA